MRRIGLLRRTLGGLRHTRAALDRRRLVLGRRAVTSLRFHTIALLMGDPETAMATARRGVAAGDEQALFVHLASLWQVAGAEAAHRDATEAIGRGGDRRIRAVTRFYDYVDQPELAERAVDDLRRPDAALLVAVGEAWRRHGQPERALVLFERAIAWDPGHERARAQRTLALGDLRLLRWSWTPALGVGTSRPSRRRVLYMVERSLPHHTSGSTYRTHHTVLAQRAAGLDSHVVTQPGFPVGANGSGPPMEVHAGIPYHRLASRSRNGVPVDTRLAHHAAQVATLVEELRPAILHPASDYRNATVAIEVGKARSIPVVYEVRGFPEVSQARRPGSSLLYEQFGTRRAVEAECWRRADHVVTLAEVMRRHIEANGVEPDRITVIPNAVDTELFAPRPRDEALAARLGLGRDDLVLGYVGTFSSYEGLHFLIEAVALLAYGGRRIRALLVGDGTERARLEQLARRLKVAHLVTFTGRVEHGRVPSYYALIDIFAVPRTAEITSQLVTPLKPYEAMAMERTVVVSATEALLEVVTPGVTGMAFEPEDAEALAHLVDQLIDDPGGRAELGAAARRWTLEHRTWAQNVDRYRALYAELSVET